MYLIVKVTTNEFGLGWVIVRASTHGCGTATPAPRVLQNGTAKPRLGLPGSSFL